MDQLNGLLIQDLKTIRRMERHAPHHYALDMNKPDKAAGYLALPAPVVANIAGYVNASKEQTEHAT